MLMMIINLIVYKS